MMQMISIQISVLKSKAYISFCFKDDVPILKIA